MIFLIVHPFPTATAFLFAIQLISSPSVGGLFAYLWCAFLGGCIHAWQTMTTDNKQLRSLGRAVKDIGITKFTLEDYSELLPKASLDYIRRRFRIVPRKKSCIFVNSEVISIRDPVAFGFERFSGVCLHSLGAFTNTPSPRNMILYHEFGHLFVYQPRGGPASLLFGTAIPVLWLGLNDPAVDLPTVTLVILAIALQAFTTLFFDGFHRELSADSFAMATWFTATTENLTQTDRSEISRRGRYFEEIPADIRAYGDYVASENRIRKRAWFRAYGRMNRYGRLNRFSDMLRTEIGIIEPYWEEVFYRRYFLELLFSVRVIFGIFYFLTLCFLFSQLTDVALKGGLGLIMVLCVAAMLVLWVLSMVQLPKAGSVVNQAEFEAQCSVAVVMEAV